MDASIAGGIFALIAGLVTLISGKYSDRVKENELIVVLGYLITGLGFFLHLWVNSVTSLFLVQVVTGLGGAIYAPAFDSVYSKHLTQSRSGSQWGAWESTNYFTTALGAIFGGAIATYIGFRALFVVMAGLCFCSGLYIYRLKRNIL